MTFDGASGVPMVDRSCRTRRVATAEAVTGTDRSSTASSQVEVSKRTSSKTLSTSVIASGMIAALESRNSIFFPKQGVSYQVN
jgi:hypothetical protein